MRDLRKACIDGAVQTAVVMLLVASSALIGTFLTEAQLPQALAQSITGVTSNPYVVLLLLNVFFLILGMFLHSAAAIILTVPIVMPMIAAVHIDPIHFGLVLTLNLAIGQQTPPVASVLIASCAIAKTDIWETTKVNLPFIAGAAGGAVAVHLRAVDFAGAGELVLRQHGLKSGAHERGALDHRLHFAERHLARQIFHAAIGRDHQPLGRHIGKRLADARGDDFRRLDIHVGQDR